jgi:hypothetical protein
MSRTEIIEAIENTKHFNATYWAKALKQRAGLAKNGEPNQNRAGGYYPEHSAEDLEAYLLKAYWEPLASEHVRPEFRSFTTPLPGILGIICLKELDPKVQLRIDDYKNTGYANLYYQSDLEILADETTLLISQKATSWKVITFFPGKPIQGQKIIRSSLKQSSISAGDAIQLGFGHAKLTKIST